MSERTERILSLLEKWNKLYNNNADDMVSYYMETIKEYVKSENPSWYRELFTILDDDVFTLKCQVGLVYCCIEFNEKAAGATFENVETGENVFVSNQFSQDTDKIARKMFNIFD